MNTIFLTTLKGEAFSKQIDALNKKTIDWTEKAARGECGWICSDCCVSFPDGMPDECAHGHADCTKIIHRDKKASLQKDIK